MSVLQIESDSDEEEEDEEEDDEEEEDSEEERRHKKTKKRGRGKRRRTARDFMYVPIASCLYPSVLSSKSELIPVSKMLKLIPMTRKTTVTTAVMPTTHSEWIPAKGRKPSDSSRSRKSCRSVVATNTRML